MDQQKHIEALETVVGHLWKRVEEAILIAETLRELLEQREVLSSAEIEGVLAKGRLAQQAGMLKAFERGLEAFEQDVWRRVLEGLKGPSSSSPAPSAKLRIDWYKNRRQRTFTQYVQGSMPML